jgi:hypothetical protein
MSIHSEPFEGVGKSYELNAKGLDAETIRIEDYWDRVSGLSWTLCSGNPAAPSYAMRSGMAPLPLDDEVVYGKVEGFGHLVHISELGEVRS